jgi:hypothetical protein
LPSPKEVLEEAQPEDLLELVDQLRDLKDHLGWRHLVWHLEGAQEMCLAALRRERDPLEFRYYQGLLAGLDKLLALPDNAREMIRNRLEESKP